MNGYLYIIIALSLQSKLWAAVGGGGSPGDVSPPPGPSSSIIDRCRAIEGVIMRMQKDCGTGVGCTSNTGGGDFKTVFICVNVRRSKEAGCSATSVQESFLRNGTVPCGGLLE